MPPTLAAWALAAILHLAPFMLAAEARAVDLAEAVAGATDDREEQALLVGIMWWETGRTLELGLVGDHGHSVSPWQLWTAPGSARQRELAASLPEAAREAVARVRASRRACRALGPDGWLAQYTSGRCFHHREARQRWRTAMRLLREVRVDGEAEDVPPSPAREAMMQLNQVVVSDPAGEYWEGSLVETRAAAIVRSRGGVLLPVDAELFRVSGVGGYFRRGWGSGWPLDNMTPRSLCPMALYVAQAHRSLHWAARLMPDSRLAERARAGDALGEGQLAVIAEASRATGLKAGLAPERGPVHARELGRTDEQGGWTVGGTARLSPPGDGLYEFALYGTMPGVRVAWAACSTTI